MQVALAHHWLVGMRGGEKVLEQFDLLFPHAPIYTLVANPPNLTPTLRRHKIHQSPLGLAPGAARHYKKMLPLFPQAVKALQVSPEATFLLSSDASVIKGLSYNLDIPHVCYCHTPPRYLWGMEDTYLAHSAGLNGFARWLFKNVVPGVRTFDLEGARRVTHFIANSRFVQKRIRDCYGRNATVIYPPVNVDDFCWDRPAEDFYLVVSELVPYKRIDLAVDAFNRLGKKLVILGSGSELLALKSRANSNITFLGRQPFPVLKSHYERCRAFIFPGVEDFGITMVEAQAAGRPVIAFGQGGALETVRDNATGMFFQEQTPDALAEAVLAFEQRDGQFDPLACRCNAERFRPERFRQEIVAFLAENIHGSFAFPE